jgi:pre-mRNA-splicing factor ISY1
MEIVKETGRMITEIQLENLDEHRIRDLNDQINKKMRLKRAWEHRIVELGGPNYLAVHPTQFTDPGIAPDMKGGAYRYYGAAKNLPGVRELLANAAPSEKRAHRTIEQINRSINVAYYGYLDDDDGVLIKAEAVAEKRLLEQRVADWEEEEEAAAKRLKVEEEQLGEEEKRKRREEEKKKSAAKRNVDSGFKSHVTLPSQEEIEALIVARKKKDLLAQYGAQ